MGEGRWAGEGRPLQAARADQLITSNLSDSSEETNEKKRKPFFVCLVGCLLWVMQLEMISQRKR